MERGESMRSNFGAKFCASVLYSAIFYQMDPPAIRYARKHHHGGQYQEFINRLIYHFFITNTFVISLNITQKSA